MATKQRRRPTGRAPHAGAAPAPERADGQQESAVVTGLPAGHLSIASPLPLQAPFADRGRTRPRDRYKRPFDLAVLALAAVGLVPVWLPLCLLVALAIRLQDGGPVVHVQRRVGRLGEPFDMLKFRTMANGAERKTGPVLAKAEDPRITRIGAVLRRCHLDELPQVINVIRGEMSLVGPRPERPALVRRILRKVPAFQQRLSVTPGIAGLAQARGGYHTPPRIKLRYDRVYIANMGPWLDLKILAACVHKALIGRTASRNGRNPVREMLNDGALMDDAARRRRVAAARQVQ